MSLYDSIKNAQDKMTAFNLVLNQNTRSVKQLISVMIELSPVCNFTCPFCYARKTPAEMHREGKSVRDAAYWKGILDQLAEMGVLYVGFTGGECMLCPDFEELYRYAIRKGFLVSMISNMSCLTGSILDMFIQYPPKNISVTVYGASDDTYERICGSRSFTAVTDNLERLKQAGIPFKIQMTVSKENVADMPAVYRIAERFGTTFTFSEVLINFQRCTKEAQAINSVDEAAFMQTVIGLGRENGEEYNREVRTVPKASSVTHGTICSAGQNAAFFNFEGNMQPCVSFSDISVPADETPVKECWHRIVEACSRIPQIPECNGCVHWSKCRHCFAMHYYDTHDFTVPSPRLCFKLLHPDEAARIEAYYNEHGTLPPRED